MTLADRLRQAASECDTWDATDSGGNYPPHSEWAALMDEAANALDGLQTDWQAFAKDYLDADPTNLIARLPEELRPGRRLDEIDDSPEWTI